MPGLIKALEYEKDHGIRRDAAASLGNANEVRAVEPLIASLRDSEPAVCRAAATALGLIGDPRAVEPLIRIAASQDADQDVRNDAVKALVTLGSGAVKPLVDSLRSRSPDIRQVATETLGQVGSPAVEVLVAALGEQDADVRAAATEALGKLGWQPDKTVTGAIYWAGRREWGKCVEIGAPAVKPLIAALRDSNGEVRQAAAATLVQIGAPAVGPLIAVLDDDYMRGYAVLALVEIGAPSVQPLITALDDAPKDVRNASIRALGKIGDARAVEPLSEWLNEGLGGDEEREAIAEALGQIGDARAVEALLWRFEHSDGHLSEVAAAALFKVGWRPDKSSAAAKYWVDKGRWDKCVKIGSAAVEPLCAALQDGEHGVNIDAAEALGKIGDPHALPPLVARVKHLADLIDRKKNPPDIGDYVWNNTLGMEEISRLESIHTRLVHAAAEVAAAQIEPKSRPSEGPQSAGNLAALLQQLSDTDSDIRMQAARELGTLKDPRAIEALVKAYETDSDSAVREFAATPSGRVIPSGCPTLAGSRSCRNVSPGWSASTIRRTHTGSRRLAGGCMLLAASSSCC